MVINFLSLNLTSIGIEGERGIYSQNDVPWGGGEGAQKQTRTNKGGGGGQNSGILSERTF